MHSVIFNYLDTCREALGEAIKEDDNGKVDGTTAVIIQKSKRRRQRRQKKGHSRLGIMRRLPHVHALASPDAKLTHLLCTAKLLYTKNILNSTT